MYQKHWLQKKHLYQNIIKIYNGKSNSLNLLESSCECIRNERLIYPFSQLRFQLLQTSITSVISGPLIDGPFLFEILHKTVKY